MQPTWGIIAEADVCDGVYQLVFLSPEVLILEGHGTEFCLSIYTIPHETYGLSVMVIDEFYQRTCHVTLGSNVTKLHSALERNPCTSYQTYFSFPSPAPFPPRMRTRKYTDGLRDYCSVYCNPITLQNGQ